MNPTRRSLFRRGAALVATGVDFDLIETLYGLGYRIKELSEAPKPTAP